jgi:hypothetical protein
MWFRVLPGGRNQVSLPVYGTTRPQYRIRGKNGNFQRAVNPSHSLFQSRRRLAPDQLSPHPCITTEGPHQFL